MTLVLIMYKNIYVYWIMIYKIHLIKIKLKRFESHQSSWYAGSRHRDLCGTIPCLLTLLIDLFGTSKPFVVSPLEGRDLNGPYRDKGVTDEDFMARPVKSM